MSLVRYRANPYNRMYKRTSSNARARGQFAAAKKSNDRLEFVVNCNHVFTASYNPADESGVAAINVWDVLERNGYFSNLSNMYDQIKIDGITVKLSVTNAITDVQNFNQIKNITTYVGWDRTGLSTNQIKLYDSSNNEIPEMNDDEAEVKSWRTNIGSAIVKATGVVKNEINSFQRWRYSTYLYPSLLQEKQQYITTSDIKRFNKGFDVNSTKFTVADRYNNQTPNGLYDSSNPVIPFESSNVKFKPTLLVGVFQNGLSTSSNGYGEITQYGKCNPVIFNAEFSISCSFKNLKGVSDQYRISEGGNRLMLSFIPSNSSLSSYQTINIPNLKNSIYIKENEKDENYATNLTVLLPGDVIPLYSIQPVDDSTLTPDTTPAHTIPFSTFRLIEGSNDNNTSNEIIIPAAEYNLDTHKVEPKGAVICARDDTGVRMWPILNNITKPIKTYARKALKYAPLGFNILNKLVGVCKLASGDATGLTNILNIPFYQPQIEEAEIEAAQEFIILSDEQRITSDNNGAFLPFSTFSIAI